MLLTIPAAVSPPWTTLLGFSLLPAVVMIAGAALAVWRAPGPKLRSAILHFAAGVIFSVVAVELLPDIVQHHAPYEVAIGFGLGVATMLGLRYFTQRLEKQQEATSETAAATGSPARRHCRGACWLPLVLIFSLMGCCSALALRPARRKAPCWPSR